LQQALLEDEYFRYLIKWAMKACTLQVIYPYFPAQSLQGFSS
jgi:hypothetical protein